MINALFVVGNVGSGKTALWEQYQVLLSSLGIDFQLLTDRWALEDAVLEDTGVKPPHNGTLPVEGSLSKYWGGMGRGKIKFEITNGGLGNAAHEQIIQTVASDRKNFYLVEYAIAPEIQFANGGPFDQTGDHLLELLRQYSCADNVCVVEPQASLAVRIERNNQRDDGVPSHLMEAWWYDGGEMPSWSGEALAGHRTIDNNHNNQQLFVKEGSSYFLNHIAPQLHPEGIQKRERRW